jgi:hypothetical protein
MGVPVGYVYPEGEHVCGTLRGRDINKVTYMSDHEPIND